MKINVFFLKDVEPRKDESYTANALYEIEERTDLKTDAQADEDDMNSRDSFSKYNTTWIRNIRQVIFNIQCSFRCNQQTSGQKRGE